jgi:hypothetical protein
MAYDEGLAQRVREAIGDRDDLEEKRMFGGICFMVKGHMSCGLNGNDLMISLGNEGAAAALSEPYCREMDFTGRPLRSMVYVDAEGLREDEDLLRWVNRAVAFAESET